MSGDVSKSVAVIAGVAAFLLPIIYLITGRVRARRAEKRDRTWSIPRDGNPYPGQFQPLPESHAAVLYGRDVEVLRIVRRMRYDETLTRRFAVIEGPSGCGKSSILRAGVLAELRAGTPRLLLPSRDRFTVLGPFSPADDVFAELAQQLPQVTGEGNSGELLRAEGEAGALAAAASHEPARPEHLLGRLRQVEDGSGRIVLAVDQLEELAGSGRADERAAFLCLVRAALVHERRLVVVCTLRSDFSDEFADGRGGDLFGEPERIAPMGSYELRQVIRGPAQAAGVGIEDALVDEMVADSSGADALPLLTFVLNQLYQDSARDGVISSREYRRLMGSSNAIAEYADRVVASVTGTAHTDARHDLVVQVLLESVDFLDGGMARRAFAASDLTSDERGVAEDLTRARLLVKSADSAYTMAHDILIRRWPLLQDAVRDHEQALVARRFLDPRFREWVDGGRAAHDLLSSSDISRVRGSVGELRLPLREFVVQSIAHDQEELSRQADLIAARSLDALEPRVVVREPDLALLLAREANVEFAVTPSSAYALYRTWWYGLRGVIAGHGAPIAALSASPDGGCVATASHDHTARIWSSQGALLHELRGHADALTALAWSPDGGCVATASRDHTARIWSSQGALLHELRGHADALIALAWSPDGGCVATASRDHTARIWSSQGALLHELRGHADALIALAWSPDGGCVATASRDHTARIWSSQGALLHELRGHADALTALAWSPDGGCVATASRDHTARIWSSQGALLHELRGHADALTALAWSPDGGCVATASRDHTARIWSSQGALLHELRGHADALTALAWSPDHTRLLTGAGDRTIKVWTSDGLFLKEFAGHTDTVCCVAWATDGTEVLSASLDWTARRWSAVAAIPLELHGHTAAVTAVAWAPAGATVASASVDHTLRIWSPGRRRETVLEGHAGTVNCMAWSPDGRQLASAGVDRTLMTWTADGERMTSQAGHRATINALAWSPDGRLVATASSDHCIAICEPSVTSGLAPVAGHTDAVVAVAWSPDGQLLVSASSDRTIRTWTRDGQPVHRFDAHTGTVTAVQWSPDGQLLASASSDRTIRTWTRDGEPIRQLIGHTGDVTAVQWSPDGQLLASASSDHTIRTWTRDGDPLGQFTGHTGRVNAIAWGHDGERLASASHDHTVRVWHVDKGCYQVLTGHRDRVQLVAWSPLTGELCSGGNESVLRLWPHPLPVDELIALVNSVVGLRDLSADERRQAHLTVEVR